ncbi:type II secretion system protein GspL [Massilia sp. TWR1-2-2]|uniref:type II secretion system protein GspL n=1 Tax=Massilia sp. TWR1-2-2 TaxID=2804584 RepID=UPI003CF5F415
MSTLYIRLPARTDGEAALSRFALVADNGAIEQQGEGALRGFADLAAASRRVLLLIAAVDVTMLHVKAPPLSGPRLKAALPSLVEEQVLGDPSEAVLTAAPAQSPDGLRSVAVVQRTYLESLVRTVLAMGARSVGALPAQLCLPLQPGHVTAAVEPSVLTLRDGLYHGMGLAIASTPDTALQMVRALAGDAPLTLYVPAADLGQFQALAAEADPATTIEADDWTHWIAGSRSTNLDLVPALGAAGARATDWQRWRWPLRLALLALVVNLAGLNIEWLRLKREADATRAAMLQTYKATYPKDTVIQDPVVQMKMNIARARAASGQLSPDEFTYQAAAFGEAARSLPRPLSLASLEFRERSLSIKVKPEPADPGVAGQLKSALAARNLAFSETAPATWLIRNNTGAKP